jgi:hypothetical protein
MEKADIEGLAQYFGKRKDVYVRWYLSTTFATLGLSCLVTIFGVLKYSATSTCLGAILTAALGVERALSVSEKLARYKTLEAEAQNLSQDWDEADTEAAKSKLKKRAQELRIRGAAPTHKSTHN